MNTPPTNTTPTNTTPTNTARRALPWLPAGLLVVVAIAYPLTEGASRDAVTWAIVLLGGGLSVLHAGLSRGFRLGVAVLVVVAAASVLFEALGLATGFPYGEYTYARALGPTLIGVPFLVPLAWLMMAWPSWLLAERLARPVRDPRRRRIVRIALAAAVLAGWDIVLDPQLVAAGYWRWADPHPALPGIETVPLTNLAGWLLTSALLMALLDRLMAGTVPRIGAGAPFLVLGWMTLGGALAQAGWLDLPGSAAWGVALSLPVLVALAVQHRRVPARGEDARSVLRSGR